MSFNQDYEFIMPTTMSTRQDYAAGSFWELEPGFLKMKNRVAYATAIYGYKWTKIRNMFVDLMYSVFSSPMFMPAIRAVVMSKVWAYFPVRTGHLLDYIITTLWAKLTSLYNTRHTVISGYLWPGDRPYPIRGLVAHSQDEGYSKPPIPEPAWRAPNIGKPRLGPRAIRSLIWPLNDPMAVNDPTEITNQTISTEIQDQIKNIFEGTRVILRLRVQGYTGGIKVSGGGTNTTQIP